jgi:hypothetical protein
MGYLAFKTLESGQNVQEGPSLDLNQLSNELLCHQNKTINKRYDGLIRLELVFLSNHTKPSLKFLL